MIMSAQERGVEERIRNVIEMSFEEWKEVFQLKGDINFKAERSTTLEYVLESMKEEHMG